MSKILEVLEKEIDRFKEQTMTGEERAKESRLQEKIAEAFSDSGTKKEAELLEQLIRRAYDEGLSISVTGTGGSIHIGLDMYTLTICGANKTEEKTIDIDVGARRAVVEALEDKTARRVLKEALEEPEKVTIKVYL